jgi:hypothetical protein
LKVSLNLIRHASARGFVFNFVTLILIRGRAHSSPTHPVAGAPPVVCDRDYFDLPVMDPIDKTERKVRKEVSAGSITQFLQLEVQAPPLW